MGDKAMRPSKHPMDPHDTKQLDYINTVNIMKIIMLTVYLYWMDYLCNLI